MYARYTYRPAVAASRENNEDTASDSHGKLFFGRSAVEDSKHSLAADLLAQGTRRAITRSIIEALELAQCYGRSENADEKAWVIDQMCRALLGSGYAKWVESRQTAAGSETWPTGTAPKAGLASEPQRP